MYNDKRKQRFIDQVNDDERSNIERLFDKVEVMEKSYQKDLSECDLEELSAVFHHLAPASPERSMKNKEQVEAYIDWSIAQGYKAATTNPFHPYGEEWCNQFVTSS
ncbi:hypothetical protein [Paenibacillus sp. V4I5]|uniref:phage lytic cycle repressor MrpR family protein n=1 Tax=Paenibacillus sp. V4I5 TaxID=3042306 RepID=UPI00279004ED|nr:hypothetical protein [Paenibacillus sp. V4I5]MDQ0917051.1 cytochrome c553 [Paenibacillus sp. V4I5]